MSFPRSMGRLSGWAWLVACGLTVVVALPATGEAQGIGQAPRSLYGNNRIGRSVNRSFGNDGRSPGSSYMNRVPGMNMSTPGLNSRAAFNRPQRSSGPVLSPYLNLLPGATDNFSGQFLLRTQPFERAAQQEQLMERQIQTLERSSGVAAEALEGLGAPVQPIRSGLSTTGHRVGFLSTGSYFPGR